MNQRGPLRLVHGPDVESTLSEDGVVVFGYVLNRPGLRVLGVMAAIFVGLAAYCWWDTGLSTTVWQVVFGALILAGGGIGVWILYWTNFAAGRFLAVSDSRLYVGQEKRMWAIDWDVLDAESMGFQDMELTRMKGVLTVDVGGQEIDVHLFNAFAYLDDIQQFMFEVLNQLHDGELDEEE